MIWFNFEEKIELKKVNFAQELNYWNILYNMANRIDHRFDWKVFQLWNALKQAQVVIHIM
jgi:hypothetical protein